MKRALLGSCREEIGASYSVSGGIDVLPGGSPCSTSARTSTRHAGAGAAPAAPRSGARSRPSRRGQAGVDPPGDRLAFRDRRRHLGRCWRCASSRCGRCAGRSRRWTGCRRRRGRPASGTSRPSPSIAAPARWSACSATNPPARLLVRQRRRLTFTSPRESGERSAAEGAGRGAANVYLFTDVDGRMNLDSAIVGACRAIRRRCQAGARCGAACCAPRAGCQSWSWSGWGWCSRTGGRRSATARGRAARADGALAAVEGRPLREPAAAAQRRVGRARRRCSTRSADASPQRADARGAGRSAPASRRRRATGLRVTWLGHSTKLIEIDGQRVLTDPGLERARLAARLGRARALVPAAASRSTSCRRSTRS